MVKSDYMHWADKIAKEIVASGKYKPYWVDDMKTPSGRVHIGSVRAAVTHELVYRALRDIGEAVTFSYVLEDHDPMDGLPIYVDQEEFKKHLGEPLYSIPSPDPKYKSFSECWGREYMDIFDKIGVSPKIIWGSDLYKSGKMNDLIKICLDKTQIIRGIYKTLYKTAKPQDWFPFQARCEKCGKLSTTMTIGWDGIEITYECRIDGLDWTKGCGHKGKMSPFSDKNNIPGKLPWKIEWPCKWKVIGVTVEGAGKDHMSAGGSHDFAKLMCKKVIDYPVPYPISHEFFLVGGKKMSSSRGLGSSAKEVSEMLPPYLMRFLIAKSEPNQQIDFDPKGSVGIPDLFDAYDKAWEAYDKDGDEKLARTYVLSQISKVPEKEKGFFAPRFRDIANFVSQGFSDREILEKMSESKKVKLDDSEVGILEERLKYAKVWVENYAPSEYQFGMKDIKSLDTKSLSEKQKEYLKNIKKIFSDDISADSLQVSLFELSKELSIPTKDAFAAIYTAFIGKTHGPRAGMLLTNFGKEKVFGRIDDIMKEGDLK